MWTKLPVAWETARLEEVASPTEGSFIDGDWIESPHITNTGIRLLQTGNVGEGRFQEKGPRKFISQGTFDALNCKLVHPGDLLFCRLAGPVGRCCRAPNLGLPMITSVDVTIMRPNSSRVDDSFLIQVGNSERWLRMAAQRAGGSTRSRISRSNLGKMHIPLPPLSEQKKIAAILSSVDEAIQAKKAVIEQTRRVKEGLLQDLLTRGIGHTRFKQTEIGEIPDEWDICPLGHVAQIIDPNPSHRYPPSTASGVPICSTANFVGDDDYDLTKSNFVPDDVFEEQNQRCNFEASDVVFARKGRLGFARPYGEHRKVFSHTVVLFKPRPSYDRTFLLWVARSRRLMADIERRMNSNSGVPTLGVGFISKIPVPLPSREEQTQIARIVQSAQQSISNSERELKALEIAKAGLLQDLLTGKVRVTV